MELNVREKLNKVVEEQGIKLVFIAKKMDTNYQNLVSFKTGKKDYSVKMLKKLDQFLNKFDQ